MEYADVTLPRRGRLFRMIAAAAFAALAAAILASALADAQTPSSVNPDPRHQRVNAQGEVQEGFYYPAADPDFTNYIRISFVSSARPTDGPPTYEDFGQFDFFFENPGGTNLHPGTAIRSWWFDAAGTALAACANDQNRCRMSKTEYQALAGQTGADDDVVIGPIVIGFKVPNSVTDNEIVLQSKHDTSLAARQGGSNQWEKSTWTRIDKHRANVIALNADGAVIPDYVFSNAAGNLGANLVHARISIGASHVPGFSSATYERWGSAANAGAYIRITGELGGSSVNLVNNQVQSVFFKADGTTALGCGSPTGDCYLDKAAWKALAGQADDPDTVQIKPIRLAFKVPSETQSGNPFDATSTITLGINRVGAQDDAGNNLFSASSRASAEFTRLVSHVFRLQAAERTPTGRTPLEPGDPFTVSGATHSQTWCSPSDTGSDCTRPLEVGEDMYVGSTITRGGTADTTGRFNRPGSAWLQYGPEHFDEIEISFTPTPGAGGGDAVISSGRLCPIQLPAGSSNDPFADAPRDRTAAALRVCKWNHSGDGNSYRSVGNPGGAPYWNTGTGPHLFGLKAGTGTVSVKHRNNGVLVSENSFTLTIGAPMRTNLLSSADAPMITAGIGQRNAGDPLELQIGYERRRGIPAFWPLGHTYAGSGYYGPARYEDVDSVALTVPAGGGTLEVLGTHRSCTAGSDPCTITLGREGLKQAARYGYTPADNAGGIADSDAIFPARLLLHGAASRDVAISGTLTLASGTPNTHNFSYTAKAAANAARATVAAYLPGDSDDILAPGQSAAVAVGYRVPDWNGTPPTGDGKFLGKYEQEDYMPGNEPLASALLVQYAADAGNSGSDTSAIQVLRERRSDWVWTTYSPGETDFDVHPADQIWLGADPPPLSYRYSPVPATWSVSDDGYFRNLATPEPAYAVDYVLPGVMTGAYLQITGPATWTETGSKRLRLDFSNYTHFKCVDSNTLNPSLDDSDLTRTCYVVDADGNAPSITVDRGADDDIRITADLPLYVLVGVAPNSNGGTAAVNLGSTLAINGFYRPTNLQALRRTSAFGSGTLQVETIRQLSGISLDRKPGANNVVPTTPIRVGSSAEVRLALNNENGRPSQLSAVSAITLTVIGGGTLSGQGCTNASSCTIPTGSGALFNAAKANPAVVGAIDLAYNAPAKPGDASIRATVVGNDGGTFTETLDLTISGSATELAVGGTMPRVHSSATANDDRDKILIPITAQDANGNPAPMPQNAAATVSGVGNAALPAGSHTATVKCTNESRLTCNIEIVVTAPASQPLASGAYTATVTGSGIGRTEASFAVGGPAETLSISIPDPLPGLAQGFTATVSVVDKAGVPVADGTWVAFRSTATGGGAPTAVVTSPAEADVDDDNDDSTATVRQRRAQTKNGEVSANITVVGNGIAVLTATATANDKSESEPLDTRAAAAPTDAPTAPVLEYSTESGQAEASAWATYRGTTTATADELLGHAEAPAGARIIWLWNGVRWIRYGEVGGVALPGSEPFIILPDDTVWFGD